MNSSTCSTWACITSGVETMHFFFGSDRCTFKNCCSSCIILLYGMGCTDVFSTSLGSAVDEAAVLSMIGLDSVGEPHCILPMSFYGYLIYRATMDRWTFSLFLPKRHKKVEYPWVRINCKWSLCWFCWFRKTEIKISSNGKNLFLHHATILVHIYIELWLWIDQQWGLYSGSFCLWFVHHDDFWHRFCGGVRAICGELRSLLQDRLALEQIGSLTGTPSILRLKWITYRRKMIHLSYGVNGIWITGTRIFSDNKRGILPVLR